MSAFRNILESGITHWTLVSLFYLFLWTLLHETIEIFVLLFPCYPRSLSSTIIAWSSLLILLTKPSFWCSLMSSITSFNMSPFDSAFHLYICVLPPFILITRSLLLTLDCIFRSIVSTIPSGLWINILLLD